MARGRTIKNDELHALAQKAQEFSGDLRYAAETYRRQLGTEDEHRTPLAHARIFSSLSQAAADMAHAILVKASLEEDRRDLEATLKARIANESKP